MSSASFPARYTRFAALLHWLVAALIFAMIGIGYYMIDLPRNTPERANFLNIHKSLGLLTITLVAIRVVWRITHKPPPPISSMREWQLNAARASHLLMYGCLLLQPITGYLTSSFGRYGIKFFSIPIPNWGWDNPTLREIFASAHRVIVVIFIILIALHIIAALKHALVDRDGGIRRILP
jgi:cytochrome b561